MAQRPYYTVQNGVEVALIKTEEVSEVEFDECFEEGKEVGSNFWKTVEVAGDKWKTGGKNHFKQLIEKLAIDNKIKLL